MPAQKRSLETATPPLSPPPPLDEEKPDESLHGSDNHNNDQNGNVCDSDESSESSDGEQDEFIILKLAEIRKEVQCPICLGIIRKTRTVMECLHRFCRECIDKSMRMGNKECPACRTHCASRRSLRDDPNYDSLIATLYPDIDKYEEEELAFHDVEMARNKQIQSSIAQTFRRQADALGKKRTSARVPASAFARRQGNYRNLRGRRNHRVAENQGSDEEEGANGSDGSKDSSSGDERSPEVKSKRYRKWGGARSSQPSSGANAEDDNDAETNRDLLGASAGLLSGTEILAWGRGGVRSNNRHGAHNGGSGKLSRNNRISKLVDHLECSNENEEVLKISLTLVSFSTERIPSLKRPYLCCSPTLPIRHLCQYVAMQTSLEASEVEIVIIKDMHPVNSSSNLKDKPGLSDAVLSEWQLLDENQTLGQIHTSFSQQNLVLAYRQKSQDQGN